MEFELLLHERWSPRQYAARAVDAARLRQVFEAARWAQSSFNEQPWRYLIAMKDALPARTALEECLFDGNAYAREAAVLGISFAKRTFTKNGDPNRVAAHDLGAANQLIALKAFELGLNTRFMAGFDTSKAQELAPPDFEPVAMFVIGYATESVLERGPGDRGRRPVESYVSLGEWGRPPPF